jgi:hypothetical protein
LATWRSWFNVNAAANLATWFQTSLFLLCAAVTWTLADDARADGDRWRPHWRVLSLVFGYLSLDELVGVHEGTDQPLRRLLSSIPAPNWVWALAAVIVIAVVALASRGFLSALPRATRLILIAAGVIYLAGALGVETVSSNLFARYGPHSLLFQTVATGEEGLEMLGLITALSALGRCSRDRTARTVRPLAPDLPRGLVEPSASEGPQVVAGRGGQ